MKKRLLTILVFLIIHGLTFADSLYDYPLTYDVAAESYNDYEKIDLGRYKAYIANGDISFMENPYLDDFLLGTLSKEELRLFRNMFYAAKGYIFDDSSLTEYFSKFSWYVPKTKAIVLSDKEQTCVDRIKNFENPGNYDLAIPDKDFILEQWNGGADQRGCIIKLNKNKTFEYTPQEPIRRVLKISGTWEITKGRLTLKVDSMLILLGGYYVDDPIMPFIKDGYKVEQKFEKPMPVKLPVNKMTPIYENYRAWVNIGSGWYCY